MGFYRKKYIHCTLEEINAILKRVKKMCLNIFYREKRADEFFLQNAYIVVKNTQIEVSFKNGSKAKTYLFSLDGEDIRHYKNGGEAFRIMNQYAKVQRYDKPEEIGSARQLLYKNEKFSGKRVKAYEYDLNSAFNYMLLQPIPNIETIKYNTKVKDGEIGFIEKADNTGQYLDITFKPGVFCHYVCDLMESPFKRFVEVWYDKKKNAKTKKDKITAKDILVMCIGQCQNKNPFLRACVVGRCNMYIKSLIDENTIYSNTDCIVSTVRRYDLEENLGTEIGQWKFERNGEMFAWAKEKVNYQWNDEIPVFRGISKGWFKEFNRQNKRKWDILIDDVPASMNLYHFNKEKLKVEKVNTNGKKKN